MRRLIRKTVCSVADCTKPAKAHGYCGTHYERFRLTGSARPDEPVVLQGVAIAFLDQAFAHLGPECLIWPYARNEHGYAIARSKLASRQICERLNGPPPTPKHEAAHSCGNGAGGCVSGAHLRWATHVENVADKVAHGTQLRGANHPRAKLKDAQIEEIRALRHMPQASLSEMFAVSQSTISRVINNRGTN